MGMIDTIGMWTCVFYRNHRHGFWFSAWLCTFISQLWKGNVYEWCKARHYHTYNGHSTEMVLNEECNICNEATGTT